MDDFESFSDAVDDWVFVLEGRDASARLTYANRAAERALEGVQVGAVFAKLWAGERGAELGAAFERLHDGTTRAERLVVHTRTSPARYAELRLTAGTFRDAPATFGIAREHGLLPDASRLSGQAPLSNAERKFEALFESSVFSMTITDPLGRYQRVNPAFERTTGVSAAEALGRNPVELGMVPPETQRNITEALLTEGTTQLGVVEFLRRDGQSRRSLYCTTLMEIDGVPLGFTVSTDVTDYIRFRDELRDQYQKFAALFDNIADGMFFVGPDGRFFEVNDAACTQLGYSREELLGKTVPEVSAREGFAIERVYALLEDSNQLAFETVHRTKNGEFVPVLLTIAKIEYAGKTALAGIARDLSAQKRAETEVRQARDRLRSTLQALPDLLFEIDEDGTVIEFFSSRPQLLPLPPAQMIGKNLADVLDPPVAHVMLAAVREAIAHELATGAQYRMWSPGGERWFELSVARRRDLAAEERPRAIAVAREITERKQREQELESKNDELMRFAYTVSHDLKSPLVTIKSFLGYLATDLEKGDTERVERDIQHISNAAARMDALLQDLLELSRVGRKLNPPEPVSLLKLIEETCELLAGPIRDRGAQIALPASDLTLYGDRVRLREVLQNLLDNALKFAQPGSPPQIQLRHQHTAEGVVVQIQDRGVGFDPRHRHKLFGLFEKLQQDVEGTGIGLALVKRIVEVHGGRVWIESEGVGRGTTVSFYLPAVQPEKTHES